MKKTAIVLTALLLSLIYFLSACNTSPQTDPVSLTPTGSASETAAPSAEDGVPVTGVSFPVSKLSLKIGEKQTLTAAVTPGNASDKTILYTVADPSIFSYEYGEITALSEGSAALIAETPDGRFKARCFINVSAEDVPQTGTPDPTTEQPTPTVEPPTPTIEPTTPTIEPTTETPDPTTETPVDTTTVTPVSTETPTQPVDLEIVEVSAKTVRHIFTHCLIIDPAKGCGDPHVYPYGELDADCLTVSEFKALLQSLYDNNFCLIDINDMYVVDANGRAKLADSVRVYKGKKPLVVSIDDVVYDGRKKQCGMISRLTVDGNGQLAGEIDNPDGSVTLNYEECFCLLEEFLKTHPDFSFEGNKFTLAVTGFAGILGYRTDEQTANASYREQYKIPDGTDYKVERERVKPVIAWLKAHGYNFASHTYSHSDYTNCSLDRVLTDIEKWNRNVKPLIGETKVLVYPYGAFTYADTEKHQKLLDEGFVVFCGTSQLNTLWDGSQPKSNGGTASNTGTIYLERFTVTGFTLRNYASRTNYINYYTDYYKGLRYDDETARQKAIDLANRMYDISHNNSLEYYDPNEIYDHEHRYYKILPET